MVTRWSALVAMWLLLGCDGGEPPARNVVPTPLDLSTVGKINILVTFEGAVPAAKKINMRAAAACAAVHDGPVYEDALLVRDGRLANALVWIKDGLGDRVFARATDPVVIDQHGCLYEPRIAGAMVGQPVKFVNSDAEAHNVHGQPAIAKSWNFMMSRRGSSRTIYIDKPEVGVLVACDVHPWMRAYLGVFDHPYFAVTGEDGTGALRQVPPGAYVLAAWHERVGVKEQGVTVAPGGTLQVRFAFAGS